MRLPLRHCLAIAVLLAADPTLGSEAAVVDEPAPADKADCDGECCRTVYAGTGENAIRRDTYYGTGLLVREVAGGCTSPPSWTLKGETPFEFGSIQNVVLDPTTTPQMRRLYITLSSGVTASASHATTTAPVPAGGYGIFKSENGGDDFVKLSIPGTDGERPTDLEMNPADSNLLFAGFLEKGIYRGIRNDNDGTFTWCPLNPGNFVPGGCPDPTLSGLPFPTNDPDVPDFDLGCRGLRRGVSAEHPFLPDRAFQPGEGQPVRRRVHRRQGRECPHQQPGQASDRRSGRRVAGQARRLGLQQGGLRRLSQPGADRRLPAARESDRELQRRDRHRNRHRLPTTVEPAE